MLSFSTLITITFVTCLLSQMSANPVPDPLRIPHTRPTEAALKLAQNDDATSTGGLRTQHEEKKLNVQENLIQSSELSVNPNCEIYEGYSADQLKSEVVQLPQVSVKLNSFGNEYAKNANGKQDSGEGKEHLSKFYRNGQRSSSSVSVDAIVFPASSSTLDKNPKESIKVENVRSEMSTIESPTTYYKYPTTVQQKSADSNRSKTNQPFFSFLTPEQEILSYDVLAHILRRLLMTPPTSASFVPNTFTSEIPEVKIEMPVEKVEKIAVSKEEGNTENTETIVDDDEATTNHPNDEVNFQSLYSGPKVQKIPCPGGQLRNPSGICQEKSRKLQNSRG